MTKRERDLNLDVVSLRHCQRMVVSLGMQNGILLVP